MASLFYLRECMEDARQRMDDKTRSGEERRAARSMFWHLEKRIGTMERRGQEEEDDRDWQSLTPSGCPIFGYSEIGIADKPYRPVSAPTHDSTDEARRSLMDRKTDVQIKGREAL